jgi:lysophospholipase L1-like esterase
MEPATLVELGGRQRLAVAAAWAAPALAVMAGPVRSLATAGEVNAHEGFVFAAALLWTVFLARSTWRNLLTDLVRLVLSRVSWILFALAAFLVTAVAMFNSLGAFWFGIAGSLWLVEAVAVSLAIAAGRRRFFVQVALLGLNIIALVAADVLVGVFVLPGQSHNKLFVQHDPHLGWRLRPGPPVKRRNRAYESVETVNTSGFRTPEVDVAKPAGVKRILVVGDSHAEGYTVNDDETCSRLVEKNLAAALPVQVISLGVGGFSTDQEFLSYLYYGRRFHPDLVLLLFCENDIVSNVADRYWRGRKPVFEKHGETLVLTGLPVPDERGTGLFSPDLLQKSSLVVLLEGILRNLALKPGRDEVNRERGWEITRLILRDFAQVVKRDGGSLAVMNVNVADPGRAAEDERLRAILAEFSIPYIKTAAAYTDDFTSYWVAGHWNQKGQRAVADVLTAPLLSLLRDKVPPAEK